MNIRSNRRDFLWQTAIAGAAGSSLVGAVQADAQDEKEKAKPESPNERIRFACIGVGGKGSSDTDHAGQNGEVVALCDVDEQSLDKKAERFPKAKRYFDYRKMLEEMGSKIDAVTVSTPDHTHAPAGVMAMRMGKHIYCQKPLTWSIEEARVMRTLAAEKKLVTQMGNQGTAVDGFRTGVELLRSGVLGAIKEIHVWTNRPIWPQGVARPTETPGIPNHVHWYEFLGAAPDQPYHPDYHKFAWRGWLDFGTGAQGDMACHTINVAAMGLGLFDPESAEVIDTAGIVDRATYPEWSVIRTNFGPRAGRGPIAFTWYDGGDKLPEEKRAFNKLLADFDALPEPKKEARKKGRRGGGSAGSGLLLVGERGAFFSQNDYGAEHVLLPRDKFKDTPAPEKSLPRLNCTAGQGDEKHFREFAQAIKANDPKKPMSNFDYAGRFTETVLLGVVALKAGAKIDWDAENMRARNNSAADQYIRREYRKGFSIHV